MIIRKQAFYLVYVGIIGTICFFMGKDTKDVYVMCLFASFIILSTGFVVVNCLIKSIRMGEILSPIFVANVFASFVFIVRPIQILISINNINKIYAIGMYNKLGGGLGFNELPIVEASYIGLIGILFMNLAYFGFRKSLQEYGLSTFYNESDLINNQNVLNIKQIIAIIVIMFPTFFSMFSFVLKQTIFVTEIRMIDIIWLYIICALIIYLIAYKRQTSMFIYFLIAVSAVVLGIASKRMYVVNLIICFIVPLYYLGKNRKKNIKRVIVMVVLLFALVLIYGSIRAERIGATQGTVIEQLLDEFCMYDMLLVSIKHCNTNNIGLFYGYNFLTVITTVIPGIKIAQFDHELTRIVFNGLFNGGIPVTIFGSLYFNFSYLGVVVGSFILGSVFRYMRNKCTKKISVKGIMYYSIFTTFAYDIIRVGDVGREMWTCIIMLLIAKIFMLIVPCYKVKKEKYE